MEDAQVVPEALNKETSETQTLSKLEHISPIPLRKKALSIGNFNLVDEWNIDSPLSAETTEKKEQIQTQECQEVQDVALDSKGLGAMWETFKRELLVNEHEAPQDIKRERVYNFVQIPVEMEKLMFFGYAICLDAFLTLFTLYPIRLVIALFNIFSDKFVYRADRLKGLILVANCLLLLLVDSSYVYHSVRGQSVIKLYVIFNVLEVCDKLCCSFGQDILDSFLARNSNTRHSLNPVTHLVLAIIYLFVHSMVLFYQAITLNVAINSYNNALLTLLISNQFVEIKGAVFKKFEKENLFQLTCSERFQLSVYLVIIGCRNFLEIGFSELTVDYMIGSLAFELGLVWISEVIVDWLKHAFITKFNSIRPAIYSRFKDVLCKGFFSKDEGDLSSTVARRIGFTALPLVCVVIRITIQTIQILEWSWSIDFFVIFVISYLFLLILKVFLTVSIRRYSLKRIKGVDSSSYGSLKVSGVSQNLETIDRYTLYKSRVP